MLEIKKQSTILVGLNGGIDSMATAFLLKGQGLHLIGITILFHENDGTLAKNCTVPDIDSIKAFCQKLGIEHYAVDAKGQFDSEITEQVVSWGLTAGRFPSCFHCASLKFKILLAKADLLKADFVATGHYAKVVKNLKSGLYKLMVANDLTVDQSYLLSGVPNRFFQRILLPLGDSSKKEVQEIAQRYQFVTVGKSSEVSWCFNNPTQVADLIERRTAETFRHTGAFLDSKLDIHLGEHKGFYNYVLGHKVMVQVFGSTVAQEKYVVRIDHKSNTIYLGNKEELLASELFLESCIFIDTVDFTRPLSCFVKFDLSSEKVLATLFFKNNNQVHLKFDRWFSLVPQGRPLVFYDHEGEAAKVLGVGVVESYGPYIGVDRIEGHITEQEMTKYKSKYPHEFDKEGQRVIKDFKF